MKNTLLKQNIECIIEQVGGKNSVNIKEFIIGKKDNNIDAAILYIKSLVNQDIIDRDILNPLMLQVDEPFKSGYDTVEFICKKYIVSANTSIESDISKAVEAIKSGNTVILIGDNKTFIIVETPGNISRGISEPSNEAAIKGSREGFIENIDTNIAILRRNIKDKNLTIEYFIVGRRTQTQLAVVYISDIADNNILQEIRKRINSVNVDSVIDNGTFKQYIEDSTFSPFPQIHGTERPDTVTANILEGRFALILDRSPYVLTIPAVFTEFFQAVEDYNERTLNGSFARVLRLITIPIIITLPSLYLTLLTYNIELIPVKLITPIIESRQGIYLSPFLEILSMELIVEFLREGGLRLPTKVAQTLSIVGGIIIGNTAVQSKVVSPTTLLIVGITTVSTFLVQNYEMSLSIRILRFPMLVLANALGFLGIAAGWFFLITHLLSMKSFTVEYFKITNQDVKDILIRAPLWALNKRPDSIPNKNSARITSSWHRLKRKKNK